LSLTNLLNKSKRKSIAFSIKLFPPYNIASSPVKGEGSYKGFHPINSPLPWRERERVRG